MRIIMVIKFSLNVFVWQPSLSSQRVSVSPSAAVRGKLIYVSVCVDEDKQGELFIFTVRGWCMHVCSVCAMCGVCLLCCMWFHMFGGFGFGPEAVTDSRTLLGICGHHFCCTNKFFRTFSHRGIGEEPGKHVFLLSRVYFLPECVCSHMYD